MRRCEGVLERPGACERAGEATLLLPTETTEEGIKLEPTEVCYLINTKKKNILSCLPDTTDATCKSGLNGMTITS
jgi:hypothetical protein